MSPNFGSITPTPDDPELWTVGTWTSEFISYPKLIRIGTSTPNNWSHFDKLIWKESNTNYDDESERYVRVNFLTGGGHKILVGDGIKGDDIGGGYRQIELKYVNDDGLWVAANDFFLVFSLFQLSGPSPIISDITLVGKWEPTEEDFSPIEGT